MKNLLIFAEGPHDVAFIQQIIEKGLNIPVKEKLKICEFPKPLNDYFKYTLDKHLKGDLSLNMAHKFLLPDCLHINENFNILIFNTGGLSNYKIIKSFLADFLYLLSIPENDYDFSIENTSFLFTYDADNKTCQNRIDELNNKIFPITKSDCSMAPGDITDVIMDKKELIYNDFSAKNDNIYYYIWTLNGTFGTLEDILIPIFQNENLHLLTNVEHFVSENFAPNFPSYTENTKTGIANKAKRNKAILTIAGQGNDPGSPQSAILKKKNLLANEASVVTKFKLFVQSIL